ncbi:hypothetical protein CERSUDRAFT_95922 [Gelatoporia subvermispora B]|uniref:Uncharacterized protein n=1 Tax=Ceriporiopsis subvermispora (strain B) TaxID=914234 RepID=M2RCV2_CERS8|nr:hypothetical protein CERSUDRAFT_95922 [Gelatoporia subvermispora B]
MSIIHIESSTTFTRFELIARQTHAQAAHGDRSHHPSHSNRVALTIIQPTNSHMLAPHRSLRHFEDSEDGDDLAKVHATAPSSISRCSVKGAVTPLGDRGPADYAHTSDSAVVILDVSIAHRHRDGPAHRGSRPHERQCIASCGSHHRSFVRLVSTVRCSHRIAVPTAPPDITALRRANPHVRPCTSTTTASADRVRTEHRACDVGVQEPTPHGTSNHTHARARGGAGGACWVGVARPGLGSPPPPPSSAARLTSSRRSTVGAPGPPAHGHAVPGPPPARCGGGITRGYGREDGETGMRCPVKTHVELLYGARKWVTRQPGTSLRRGTAQPARAIAAHVRSSVCLHGRTGHTHRAKDACSWHATTPAGTHYRFLHNALVVSVVGVAGRGPEVGGSRAALTGLAGHGGKGAVKPGSVRAAACVAAPEVCARSESCCNMVSVRRQPTAASACRANLTRQHVTACSIPIDDDAQTSSRALGLTDWVQNSVLSSRSHQPSTARDVCRTPYVLQQSPRVREHIGCAELPRMASPLSTPA